MRTFFSLQKAAKSLVVSGLRALTFAGFLIRSLATLTLSLVLESVCNCSQSLAVCFELFFCRDVATRVTLCFI